MLPILDIDFLPPLANKASTSPPFPCVPGIGHYALELDSIAMPKPFMGISAQLVTRAGRALKPAQPWMIFCFYIFKRYSDNALLAVLDKGVSFIYSATRMSIAFLR